MAAAGADVDGALITTQPGAESRTWYVTVEPRLGNIPSGLLSYVEVSDAGVVVSGTGFMGRPEAVGDYPLLDTRAAIDRANAQNGTTSGIEPAMGAVDGASGTTGGSDTGGTDVGGPDVEAPDSTVAAPCSVPEGASDGCDGTTGCGGDGCVDFTTTTANPCTVQPDGSEICEPECAALTPLDGTVPAICLPPCPQAEPGQDPAVGAPESLDCPVPDPGVVPIPEPQPLEIVLVDAEHSLVVLPANDASGDVYLVPAYRFTAEDGGQVDLPAVADEALTGSPTTTETTVPDTVLPPPRPSIPEPQPCEVLEEQDPESATTHTIQTCPPPDEDRWWSARATTSTSTSSPRTGASSSAARSGCMTAPKT